VKNTIASLDESDLDFTSEFEDLLGETENTLDEANRIIDSMTEPEK